MECRLSPTSIPTATEATRRRPKRQRAAEACERCRSKKYKCDELYPCSQCKKSKLECVYLGNYYQRETSRSASYVRELESRIAELTSQLRGFSSQRNFHRERALSSDITSCRPDIQVVPAPVSEDERPRDGSPPSPNDNDGSTETLDEEISGINQHTNSIEFHGNTSSAAFLGHLQKTSRTQQNERLCQKTANTPSSLISTLHNPGFSPQAASIQGQPIFSYDQNFYFEQAHVFMDGYFENLHFMHPFIDKENFLSRAHDLWFGRDPVPKSSFVALYLSLLSLGALVRVWDEVRLAGLTRFEWSRKLFGEAQTYLNRLRFSNDLETVQCLYLMSKICQNELNPNLTYMYLGLAIRTCLSAGFNRKTPGPDNQRSASISKTWWGLYSLEVEMSFSLGRPDTLGMDEYHNSILPERDDSEFSIIPWMVDFSRIIRRVSVEVYHSNAPAQEKLRLSLQIERQLDTWLASLPKRIRPDVLDGRQSLASLKDPKWSRRQRLGLGIRYHNVKMLLFRSFLAYSAQDAGYPPSDLEEAVSKCLDSARKTIQTIHETFMVHTFFRCWWYNTTYVMFATAIILLRISKLGLSPDTGPLVGFVDMAVQILEAMDECIVARKSVEIIKHHLREFRVGTADLLANVDDNSLSDSPSAQLVESNSLLPDLSYGLGFPAYTFEGMAGLFDDLSDFLMNE